MEVQTRILQQPPSRGGGRGIRAARRSSIEWRKNDHPPWTREITFAVAPAGRLNNAVERAERAQHNWKIEVHAGLNDLGGHHSAVLSGP